MFSSSFNNPKGVTEPGLTPKYFCKESSLAKDKLPKPKGDPCWESHVQRGMKNK